MRLDHLRRFVNLDSNGAKTIQFRLASACGFGPGEHGVYSIADQFLISRIDGQAGARHLRHRIARVVRAFIFIGIAP